MEDEMLLDAHGVSDDDEILFEPDWSHCASQDSLTTELTAFDEPSQHRPKHDADNSCNVDSDDMLIEKSGWDTTDGDKPPKSAAPKVLSNFASYDYEHQLKNPVVPKRHRDHHAVLACIEKIFHRVQRSLLDQQVLQVALLSRRSSLKPNVATDSTDSRDCQLGAQQTLNFPGSTPEEAWRFTVVLCILDLIHEALIEQVVISKRDIYYKAPALFGKQAVVDKYIDDIACTFGVPRIALNVTAAGKGLAMGAFNILKASGEITETGNSEEGMIIRHLKSYETIDVSNTQFVLVVEKEATFRALIGSQFWHVYRSKGIVLTAKGYPDIATRALLQLLTQPSSRNGYRAIPTYCLVDYDPDGLAIYSTYKSGSLALAHENEHLIVPTLNRIGLRSKDVSRFFLTQDESNTNGLLRFSSRDRQMASKALQRHLGQTDADADVTGDLRTMLVLNVKCEIQALDHQPGGLNDWLEDRITTTCPGFFVSSHNGGHSSRCS